MFRLAAVAGAITLALFGGAFALSSGTGSQCTTGTVDIRTVAASSQSVAGFSGDQLVNAAQIMNAATAAGLPQAAQIIGVMTAIGESSLRNLIYGDNIHGVTNPDGTPTTSLGLFQQQDWWGTRAQRLDPSQAATQFFARLNQVPDWEKIEPTEAAHLVQRNADPDYYSPFFEPAGEIVQMLASTGGVGDCALSGDSRALAQELVEHADNGTLVGLVPDHLKEIRWIAQGKLVPDCGIDPHILQIIVLAVRNFHSVGVSDINRRCTGQLLGAGGRSSHNVGGGGKAVDLYMLDGVPLTGADGQSVRLISLILPTLPAGSRIGQSECREAGGMSINLDNVTQFADSCTHLHVDVAFAR
jgi:hypothetical protein